MRSLSSALALVFLGLILLSPSQAHGAGATLSISPTTGTFTKDGTLEVGIYLNTGGVSVNAVELTVNFPAPRMQVINPSAGTSSLQLWVTPPNYSNTAGTIHLSGGVPNPGLNSSGALITTVTFRLLGTGPATLSFGDDSKVLANDGSGTNILSSKVGATYSITLPPPSGPVVTSATHPDTNLWYNYSATTFEWTKPSDDVTGYSFVLDQIPTTVPDKKVTSTDTSISYDSMPDGRNYFHIRAQNADGWGGPTHFLVKIDKTPPAIFKPFLDRIRTTPDLGALLSFATTDSSSGVSRYEVRLVDLAHQDQAGLFTEQISPYKLPKLATGNYQVIVRAYDAAGNFTDGTANLSIVAALNPWDLVINAINLAPAALAPARAVVFILLALLAASTVYLLRRSRDNPVYRADRDVHKIEEDLAALSSEEAEVSELKKKIEGHLAEVEEKAGQGQISPEKHGLLHTIKNSLEFKKRQPH